MYATTPQKSTKKPTTREVPMPVPYIGSKAGWIAPSWKSLDHLPLASPPCESPFDYSN
jgi:hypothetical protein